MDDSTATAIASSPFSSADAGLQIGKERFLTEEEHCWLEGMWMSRDAWRGARAWEIYGVGEAGRWESEGARRTFEVKGRRGWRNGRRGGGGGGG
jgi:hypothetical protein